MKTGAGRWLRVVPALPLGLIALSPLALQLFNYAFLQETGAYECREAHSPAPVYFTYRRSLGSWRGRCAQALYAPDSVEPVGVVDQPADVCRARQADLLARNYRCLRMAGP